VDHPQDRFGRLIGHRLGKDQHHRGGRAGNAGMAMHQQMTPRRWLRE
jgi:hypothetical protein